MKPMKMARLSLVALLAAVISFFSLAAHAEATSQRPAVLPADVNSKGAEYARTILNRVNELRTGLGLKPVTRIAELDAVAQDWSEQMASRNSMEHRPNFTDHYTFDYTAKTMSCHRFVSAMQKAFDYTVSLETGELTAVVGDDGTDAIPGLKQMGRFDKAQSDRVKEQKDLEAWFTERYGKTIEEAATA